MAEVGKADKAIDGALDHISKMQTDLAAAHIALFEVREAALPFQGVAGPMGLLASTILLIVDNTVPPVEVPRG